MLQEIIVNFENDQTVIYVDPAEDISEELQKAAERQDFNVNEIESYKVTGQLFSVDEILI